MNQWKRRCYRQATGQSMYEVSRYERTNLGGSAALYELLAKTKNHRVERIVVASSRAIYGEGAYSCEEHSLVYPCPEHSKRSGTVTLIHYARSAPQRVLLSQPRRVPAPTVLILWTHKTSPGINCIAYFGSKSSITITGAFREGDIRHGMADLSLAAKLIGTPLIGRLILDCEHFWTGR